MKIIQAITLAAFTLTLAACNSNDETAQNANSATDIAPTNTQTTTDHGAEDKSETNIGFELSGDNIEEATNVPEKEKTALLESFTEYKKRSTTLTQSVQLIILRLLNTINHKRKYSPISILLLNKWTLALNLNRTDAK